MEGDGEQRCSLQMLSVTSAPSAESRCTNLTQSSGTIVFIFLSLVYAFFSHREDYTKQNNTMFWSGSLEGWMSRREVKVCKAALVARSLLSHQQVLPEETPTEH